jgi:hypothetical protein
MNRLLWLILLAGALSSASGESTNIKGFTTESALSMATRKMRRVAGFICEAALTDGAQLQE